jgi:hypothetical protein
MKNSEFKYQITIDPHSQFVKPTKPEMGKISNSITLRTGVTINEFSSLVAYPNCYTWFGGTLTGKICRENWEEHNLIALDFDKGLITIDNVIERLRKEELPPQLWYNSLSDSPELRKFRIVFLLDQPIRNASQYEIIMKGLLCLFPEADQSCKNLSRFFLGGKSVTILHEGPISTLKLINKASLMVINNDGGKNRKIPADLLNTPNGQKQLFLYYSNGNNPFLPKTNLRPFTTTSKGAKQVVINWTVARSKVKILDSFLNGEWLFHDQLFGLATNMMNIKGGKKKMLDTMEKFNAAGVTSYTQNNFDIFTYLKKVSYPAIPIHQFSTYADDLDLHDIVSATIDQRGYIEITKPIDKIPLRDAVKIMNEKFQKAMNDIASDKIYLFVLPTAIGKTEMLTDITATIAAPTNELKNEIKERMKVESVIAPDSITFETQFLNNKVSYYYTVGLPKKAMAVIHDVSNEKNRKKYPTEDVKRAKEYLAQLSTSTNSTDTVLTTHTRALYTEFQHDTIIFDEDPLKSLIEIQQFELTDLIKLMYKTYTISEDLNAVIEQLENAEAGVVHKTTVSSLDIESLVERLSTHTLNSNLVGFFSSSFFYRNPFDLNTIHYVTKRSFPKNKKIIILSATLPVDLYKKLYGDKVKVIDIRNVEQCGKVIQYTKRSCSRRELRRYHESISKDLGDLPVITFMHFRNHFQHSVPNMYFGNCEGYDTLKGKDLAVVGTPHRNNVVYFLTAAAIGEEISVSDMEMKLQKIEYNGFKFTFNCYSHTALRNIQLSLIESDLTQAVGRARTLRYKAKVFVYSNFPLQISDQFIY